MMNSDAAWADFDWARSMCLALILMLTACGPGGEGSIADNGGMSGTGISQGVISSFGSIFVNGVQWDLSSARVEIDGASATESDLRVGMVVRIEGNFESGNLSGTALEIAFENLIEGPVENTPVETVPATEKVFSILGQVVRVNTSSTVFDGGSSFGNIAEDDVLEITGFEDASGEIVATRVALRGVFPEDDEVERIDMIANLVPTSASEGVFDLGTVMVNYSAATDFVGVSSSQLANGDRVEVEGILRASGAEIDATQVEFIEGGELEGLNLERVEVEGVAVACSTSSEFCVGGIPVDTSMATFEPSGFVPMIGDEIEAEGPLVNGVLVASEVESEDDDGDEENVKIEAAVSSVDGVARTLVILGVTVSADGDTQIEDDSSADDENFMFGEIMPGDFLVIEGISTGVASVLALDIEREDATAGDDDLVIEGPVTALDRALSSLSVLGQTLPLDAGTLYFDDDENSRSEEEFFRTPGDIMLGDLVEVVDESASSLSVLNEVDEIEIQEED